MATNIQIILCSFRCNSNSIITVHYFYSLITGKLLDEDSSSVTCHPFCFAGVFLYEYAKLRGRKTGKNESGRIYQSEKDSENLSGEAMELWLDP